MARGSGKMKDQTSFSLTLCGFLLVSLLLKEAESSCRRGWLVYQGFCYGLFNDRKTWADAEADCQSMGAHLASIHGKEESSKVAEYVSAYSRGIVNKNVWIGMRFDSSRKRWTWVDRTKIIFLGGKVGEPNNFNLFGPEECVQLVSELKFLRWEDARCAKTRPYLCKHMNISG